MTVEFLTIGAALIWWTLAVVIFVAMTGEREGSAPQRICGAVFWPVFAVMQIPIVLWRIPFKAARTIRSDLNNRKLLREFNEWLERREESK